MDRQYPRRSLICAYAHICGCRCDVPVPLRARKAAGRGRRPGEPVDDNGARDVPQKNQETLVEPELEQLFERVSGYFSLLSEPTRLKILNTLCDGERSVGDIVERTGASQTNVSRNLNLMYGRGVLRRRREGAMTFYAIATRPWSICAARCACRWPVRLTTTP